MKILLVCPPFYRTMGFYNRYYPFAPALLATLLKKAGHEVLLYDADVTEKPTEFDYGRLPEKYPDYLATFKDEDHALWREARALIADFRPDLTGIAVYTAYAASAFHLAALVKRVRPECPVVLGGPHASAMTEEVLRICPSVDYVIAGEAEDALPALADCLAAGDTAMNAIPGLARRTGDKIVANPPKPAARELDRYAWPDRSLLLNHEKYSSEDMGLLMATRGCPFNCSYCATRRRHMASRSIDNVIAEIRAVKDRYGTVQFTFKDDSFTVDKRFVAAFCERLRREKLKIFWECNTRVDLLDVDTLRAMRRAGCDFIKIGIESGSEKILKAMNKKIGLDDIRRTAASLRRSGIHWSGYFMIGVPGETAEDIRETSRLMTEIKPDLALLGVYEPFPGTAMFADGVRRGLVRDTMRLKDFFSMSPNDYYKVDPRIQTDLIASEDFARLETETKALFHDYNKSPRAIAKMALAKTPVYLRAPGLLWEDFRKFLRY